MKARLTFLAALMLAGIAAQAQNPIIRDQFSADPSALVVGDRVYVKAIASIIDIETEEMISAVAYAREADSKKGMDDAQVTGATSSYARKYALNGLFLLDDTKDADDETTYLENKKAYMALVSYCTDHGIDITKLCRDRKLTKESTKADFEAALDYAKTL